MAISSSSLSLSSSFHKPAISTSISISSSKSSLFLNHTTAAFFRSSRLSVARPRPDSSARRGLSCTCLFGLGMPELAVIAGVAALVFGPKQLPEIGRNIGKTVKSFQQLMLMDMAEGPRKSFILPTRPLTRTPFGHEAWMLHTLRIDSIWYLAIQYDTFCIDSIWGLLRYELETPGQKFSNTMSNQIVKNAFKDTYEHL